MLAAPPDDPMDRLFKLVAFAMPSVASLAARNTDLAAEVDRHRKVEEELRRACGELEAQGGARPDEGARANEQLHQEIQDRRRTEQSLRYSETLLRRLHED